METQLVFSVVDSLFIHMSINKRPLFAKQKNLLLPFFIIIYKTL